MEILIPATCIIGGDAHVKAAEWSEGKNERRKVLLEAEDIQKGLCVTATCKVRCSKKVMYTTPPKYNGATFVEVRLEK